MNWLFGILDFCLKAFFQISKNSIFTMREQLGTTYIKLNSLNIFFFLRKKLVKIIEIMNLIELWIINYSNDFVNVDISLWDQLATLSFFPKKNLAVKRNLYAINTVDSTTSLRLFKSYSSFFILTLFLI